MSSQEKLVALMLKATSLNDKQLERLVIKADEAANDDNCGEAKGFHFSESTYIYTLPTGYYYARINLKKLIPGYEVASGEDPCIRKGLGSVRKISLDDAKKKCWQLEADMRAVEKHGELKVSASTTTDVILIRFIKKLRDKMPTKRSTAHDYVRCLEKYLLPAVEGNGALRNFTTKFLHDYFDGLRNTGAIKSETRLTVHRTAVESFISHCAKEGLIKDGFLPKMPSVKQILDGSKLEKEQKNEPIEAQDLIAIRANFGNFFDAIQRQKPAVLYVRTVLKWYFEFLCEMGCRPGEETMGVQFKEIVKKSAMSGEYYLVTFSKGKTAETQGPRQVELLPDAVEIVKSIAEYRFGRKMSMEEIIKLDGYVFYDEKTQKMPMFVKIWEQYRDFLNERNLLSKHYNLYSCRHEHINKQLDVGVSIRDIARHCGNSIATIEQHYEQYNVERQKNRREE